MTQAQALTFTAGDQVTVRVPAYSHRQPAAIKTLTVVRVTPTGALRLSDGELYRFDGSQYSRWCTLARNIQSRATVLGPAS